MFYGSSGECIPGLRFAHTGTRRPEMQSGLRLSAVQSGGILNGGEIEVSDPTIAEKLKQNLADVERRLADACRRSDRSRTDVTLVAVTKSVSVEIAALFAALGIEHLGENRPQELWDKANRLPKSIRWHLIGHLQRNKIARTLPLVERIHSVDSIRLLQSLDEEAAKLGRCLSVLLEFNLSGESQKLGFSIEDCVELVPAIRALTHVQVDGLMTMAALQDAEACRPTFARLRELRDELSGQLEAPHRLVHLSMGMSNDFEIAVEEGATLIRLGSVLFEGVQE